MNTQILESSVEFHHWPSVRPFPLRSGVVTEVTEARATVRVRVGGREAAGRGAILLSYMWAWPDEELPHQTREAAMRTLTERIAADLPGWCGGESAHPTELGLRLHHRVEREAEDIVPAVLARIVCASPFDAAIHDAVGMALNRPALELYDAPVPLPSADPLFAGRDACAAIRRALHTPVPELPAWMIVGPQTSADEIREWGQGRGYRCFKLRIPVEPGPDVARTVEVFDTVRGLGIDRPRVTVDSNEQHRDASAVLDYLERLRAASAEAFAALEYLEQPTHRDIRAHPFDWRPVARLKPVVIDEGLTSADLFEDAVEQGWSALALKTCKGHSFSLVANAWARERGMAVTMQDLTNPGLAAIHSALFAARVDAMNGVELNSPQYIPAANADWLPRLSGLLDPTGGAHQVPPADTPGIGSIL